MATNGSCIDFMFLAPSPARSASAYFMYHWFCPIILIHLMRRKSLYFEKKLDRNKMLRTWRQLENNSQHVWLSTVSLTENPVLLVNWVDQMSITFWIEYHSPTSLSVWDSDWFTLIYLNFNVCWSLIFSDMFTSFIALSTLKDL